MEEASNIAILAQPQYAATQAAMQSATISSFAKGSVRNDRCLNSSVWLEAQRKRNMISCVCNGGCVGVSLQHVLALA